ncbi:MAG: Fe-Mn family superoxide dismutase, partial [Vicinamibacteria bacterium]
LDLYEHAYQMDFGAAAAKYVDAFFANVQWDEVHKRLEAARKA